jgi:flap endonuclease-1
MGLKFKDIVTKKEVSLSDLKNKILAVDSMNLLYQFLTTIRGPDGTVLTDKEGRVTSHLIGLFSRTTSLMEAGLKLVFVFDGKAPEIKRKTWEKRTAIKKEASLKLKEAEFAGDIKEMKKLSARTAILTKDMVSDAKNLINLLGLPIVQAPSEGEAQTAYMVKMGDAYASVSQDYDNLIFGCSTLVRNLSIEGKRKKIGQFGFQKVKPEIIILEDVLNNLGVNQDQLIVAAILSGTDYNPGGIRGIGPKKSLKLLKEYGNDFEEIFKQVHWDENCSDLSWKEIFDTIKEIPVTDEYELKWEKVNEKELIKLLVDGHGFSIERVTNKLNKLKNQQKQLSQKGLSSFFN